MHTILVINPGSTSTKVALFRAAEKVLSEKIHHATSELLQYSSIIDQFELRLNQIKSVLQAHGIEINRVDAFVGRGGLLHPIPSGTYEVNQDMLNDLKSGIYGQHASNLGALLAHHFADSVKKRAYIVDPVVVDEMQEVARLSGHPELPRKSIFHALNHKATARRLCQRLDKPYHKSSLIIAHMGGGISIAAHKNGQCVDVNNALDGEGPFSPERSGSLPAGDLVRRCFSSSQSLATMLKELKGNGGMVAYLGTNSVEDIKQRIRDGEATAGNVYDAMIYQVCKEIGALATALHGSVDAIGLTGGIAYNQDLNDKITDAVKFIAPVYIFPGEFEMEALAEGVLRVLQNEEKVRHYTSEASTI